MPTFTSRPRPPLTYELLELLIERIPELAGRPILGVLFQPPNLHVACLIEGIEIELVFTDFT
jgi:hypothetical protein